MVRFLYAFSEVMLITTDLAILFVGFRLYLINVLQSVCKTLLFSHLSFIVPTVKIHGRIPFL